MCVYHQPIFFVPHMVHFHHYSNADDQPAMLVSQGVLVACATVGNDGLGLGWKSQRVAT